MQQLLKILQNPERSGQINTLEETNPMQSEGKLSWILDTGATDHVTYLRNAFVNFHEIKPIKIILPNESFLYANYVGTVHITQSLIIYDVFYIPNFTLNIIFVQKLIKHSDVQCLFFHDKCLIKNSHTLKMVGLARLSDGLYRITRRDTHCRVTSLQNFKNCNVDI